MMSRCIEMLDKLAANAPIIHYYTMFQEAWEKLPNFKYILKARCTGIGANSGDLYHRRRHRAHHRSWQRGHLRGHEAKE